MPGGRATRECLKDGKIGGVLQVQHPAHFLRLVIVVEPNVSQGLYDLGVAVVDACGLPTKAMTASRPAASSYDLGMTGGDNLRSLFLGDLNQEVVRLPLPQDFQVGVGLVEKQHGARVGIEVREQQQSLLQAASRRGQAERFALVQIGHGDFAALRDIPRGEC